MKNIASRNATFRGSEPTWANACVGENGNPQIYEYASGFASAANLLLDQVILNRGVTYYVDTFIYPICFNMRHAVELFLKSVAVSLGKLFDIRGCKIEKFDLAGSHDLGAIWGFVKKNTCQFDRRYQSIVDLLDQYVVDVATIDSTGQVFRYPFDTENRKHLTAISVLNVVVIKKRWTELEELLRRILHLTDQLLTEYGWGAFTRNLSRIQLAQIAVALPSRDKWGAEAFGLARSDLRKKFQLSSNEFSKALDLIQERHELASLCGHVVLIPDLDAAALIRFFDIWLKVHDLDKIISTQESLVKDVSFQSYDFRKTKARYDLKKKATQDLVEAIEPKTFAALSSLFYFQREDQFSEVFERIYRQALKQAEFHVSDSDLYERDMHHFLEKTAALFDILNSLNFLGQFVLVNSVFEHYRLSGHRARILERSERFRGFLVSSE